MECARVQHYITQHSASLMFYFNKEKKYLHWAEKDCLYKEVVVHPVLIRKQMELIFGMFKWFRQKLITPSHLQIICPFFSPMQNAFVTVCDSYSQKKVTPVEPCTNEFSRSFVFTGVRSCVRFKHEQQCFIFG